MFTRGVKRLFPTTQLADHLAAFISPISSSRKLGFQIRPGSHYGGQEPPQPQAATGIGLLAAYRTPPPTPEVVLPITGHRICTLKPAGSIVPAP